MNTDHNWTLKELEFAYLLSLLKEDEMKKYKIAADKDFNWNRISKFLEKNFKMSLPQIAICLIGCSETSVSAHVEVIDFHRGLSNSWMEHGKKEKTIVKRYEDEIKTIRGRKKLISKLLKDAEINIQNRSNSILESNLLKQKLRKTNKPVKNTGRKATRKRLLEK